MRKVLRQRRRRYTLPAETTPTPVPVAKPNAWAAHIKGRRTCKRPGCSSPPFDVKGPKGYCSTSCKRKHWRQINELHYKKQRKAHGRKYYATHRERIEAKKRKYRQSHLENFRGYSRTYRERHADRAKASQRKYRTANREKHKAYNREYQRRLRAANPEKARERYRKWCAANREKINAYMRARYHVKKSAERLHAKA